MTKFLAILILIAFGFFLACGESTTRDSNESANIVLPPEAGKAIYNLHCVICHGKNGKLGLNNAGDLSRPGLTVEERQIIIHQGQGAMLSYRNILSPAEIEAVARYTMNFLNEENKQEDE